MLLVLGPVRFLVDGRLVALEPRERDLLVALYLAGSSGATGASLQEQLWPGRSGVERRWWTLTSQLRGRLAQHGLGATTRPIELRGGRYRLDVGSVACDLADFRDAVRRARGLAEAGELPAAATALRSALDLWSGAAFDGVADAVSGVAAAEAESERTEALLALAGIELRRGRAISVVPALAAATADLPLDQQVHVMLARALAAGGRRAEAVDLLVDLSSRLYAARARLDPTVTALQRELSQQTAGPGRIPPPPPAPRPLLVRDREVAAAVAPLLTGRGAIVSLSGPPGVGKTAVLLAVADRIGDAYPLRPFVDLGTASGQVSSYDLLGFAARAVGATGPVPDTAIERTALLRTVVGTRPMVLVLDNVQRDAQLDGIRAVPWAGVVVVTRSAAAVPGAVQVEIGRFGRDASVEVLRHVAPNAVRADPAGARRVAVFCEGLAQSLWPVAARLRRPRWTPTRLADLLEDERRRLEEADRPEPRLHASFTVAYDGLTEPARRAFEHLGLAGRPWVTRWSAGALLGLPERDAEDVLETLTDAYLLRAWQRPGDGQDRYRMHDLLRLYATERFRGRREFAAGAAAAADRLADAYADRARQVEVSLHRQGVHPCGPPSREATGPADTALVRWLDDERAPAVAALDLAAAHGTPRRAALLGRSLMAMLEAGGHYERWRGVAATAHAAAGTDAALVAEIDAGAGTLRYYLSDLAGARASLERALDTWARLGDRRSTGYADLMLAMTLRATNEPAAPALAEARRIAAETGDVVLTVQALRCASWADRDSARWDAAAGQLEEARQLAQDIPGPPRLLAYVLRDLGVVQTDLGRLDDAGRNLRRALDVFTAVGDRHWEVMALYRLGRVEADQDRDEEAVEHLLFALQRSQGLHDRSQEAQVLHTLAVVDARNGRQALALDRLATAIAVVEELRDDRARAHLLVTRGELLEVTDPAAAHRDFAAAVGILRRGGVVTALQRAEEGLRRTAGGAAAAPGLLRPGDGAGVPGSGLPDGVSPTE